MACYAVTRRDSLDLAAPHEPLVMDDPFDPPPPPSSPKLIVDRAGVALDQPDVLLLEGPRFRRKSVKFQERRFGILNPPPEPAEPAKESADTGVCLPEVPDPLAGVPEAERREFYARKICHHMERLMRQDGLDLLPSDAARDTLHRLGRCLLPRLAHGLELGPGLVRRRLFAAEHALDQLGVETHVLDVP